MCVVVRCHSLGGLCVCVCVCVYVCVGVCVGAPSVCREVLLKAPGRHIRSLGQLARADEPSTVRSFAAETNDDLDNISELVVDNQRIQIVSLFPARTTSHSIAQCSLPLRPHSAAWSK